MSEWTDHPYYGECVLCRHIYTPSGDYPCRVCRHVRRGPGDYWEPVGEE
jgi:hypothetical protein